MAAQILLGIEGIPSTVHIEISPATVVVATKEQVSCELGSEAVILHMPAGMYFGLNEVGSLIWSLIQQPRSVADICDEIVGEYEVTEHDCLRDVISLLQRMATARLIQINGQ